MGDGRCLWFQKPRMPELHLPLPDQGWPFDTRFGWKVKRPLETALCFGVPRYFAEDRKAMSAILGLCEVHASADLAAVVSVCRENSEL